jgi:hypothetical protein
MAAGSRRQVLRAMTVPGAALVAAALALVPALTGCGGSASPGPGSTLGAGSDAAVNGNADASSDSVVDALTHFDRSAEAGPDAFSDATIGDSEPGSCDPADCSGCCAQGVCYPGIDVTECGAGGQACQSCAAEQACVGQKCTTTCGAANCIGCCSGTQCLGGSSSTACGRRGAPCADCTSVGGTCALSDAATGGACTTPAACNPHVCPQGCCEANGVCTAGSSPSACGSGGAACEACPQGQICQMQRCVPSPCTPQNCAPGCCDTLGVCEGGDQDDACGIGGASCVDCRPAGQCSSTQRCATPLPACSCPAGCCDANNQCQPGASNTECGDFGSACTDCTATGAQCSGQECVAGLDAGVCNQQSCPSGCCDEYGVCQQGITSSNCGIAGAACQSCLAYGFVCSNQACVTPDGGRACGPVNGCRGCCDALGNCVEDFAGLATSDLQCGLNGELCIDCTNSGGRCNGGTCEWPDGSGPCSLTCSGCCDANGTCRPGFASTQCGASGGTCQDCTALTPPSTCDASGSVPACASQEAPQCPAPYPSCPASLKELAPLRQKVCSADELLNAAAGCAGGPDDCDSFFEFEQMTNVACANCLAPFDFDFAGQVGIRSCVEPYVSAACNHNSACLADCLTASCYACVDQPSTDACDVQALAGTCATYAQADACVTAALDGPAALCNPATYQNNFGAWLQAVGAAYCGM